MNSYPSRHCTLEFEVGHIIYYVEATISTKVISWPPHGFFGRFVASTGSLKPEILLRISRVEEMHRTGDEINLSRSVVSVEVSRKLMVSVSASDGSVTLTGTTEFKPRKQGTYKLCRASHYWLVQIGHHCCLVRFSMRRII